MESQYLHQLTNVCCGLDFKAYTRKELAQLYFPDAPSPRQASQHLTNLINRDPLLRTRLEASGFKKYSKILTPRQVRILAELLGSPQEFTQL